MQKDNTRFRFRVWSIKDNKYLNHYPLFIDDNGDAYVNQNDFGEDNLMLLHNVIIERCAGCKDSTGKLMFKGDTVNLNGRDYTIEINEEGVSGTHITLGCIMCIYPEDLNKATIVGNIHETEEK